MSGGVGDYSHEQSIYCQTQAKPNPMKPTRASMKSKYTDLSVSMLKVILKEHSGRAFDCPPPPPGGHIWWIV